MKKKKENEINIKPRKTGKNIKEFFPITIKDAPREQTPLKIPENLNRSFTPLIPPRPLPKEWPGNDEALKLDFGLDSSVKFVDPQNDEIKLPYSVLYETGDNIRWLRPDQYIRISRLEKEIMKIAPNKNATKIRRKVTEIFYLSENSINIDDDQMTEEMKKIKITFLKKESMAKRNKNPLCAVTILQDVFDQYVRDLLANNDLSEFYQMKFNIKIFDCFERDETEEEILQSAKCKAEVEKADKMKIQSNSNKAKNNSIPVLNQTPTINSKKKIIEAKPADLIVCPKYCRYIKWIASTLQIIKDMKIKDPYTNETIFNKIYPQKDGVPIFNPSGKYLIKLFYMGKYRMIVIDDTMPCDKNEEFLLPKCEQLEELWPALLTKAILKLYSYKYTNSNFIEEEIGDASVYMTLTRYIGETIEFNNKSMDYFGYVTKSAFNRYLGEDHDNECIWVQFLKNLLYPCSDDYNQLKKILLGFNKSEPDWEEIKTRSREADWFENNKIAGITNKLQNSINTSVTFNLPDSNITSDSASKEGAKILSKLISKTIKSQNTVKHSNSPILRKIDSTDYSRDNSRAYKKRALSRKNTMAHPYVNTPTNSSPEVFIVSRRKNESSFNFNGGDKLKPNSKEFEINDTNMDNIMKDVKHLLLYNIMPGLISDSKGKKSGFSKLHENYHRSETRHSSMNLSPSKINCTNPIIKNFIAALSPTKVSFQKNNNEEIIPIPLTKIYKKINTDFAYSIIEYFHNGSFNMKRLLPTDLSDLRKKFENEKISYKQLSKKEKKNYMESVKKLREKQIEEVNQRFQELNSQGIGYYFIKIMTNDKNNSNSQFEDFHLPFNNEQIEMAKKCILNQWDFPPPSFFEKTFTLNTDLNNSLSSIKINLKPSKLNLRDTLPVIEDLNWTKQFYINKILCGKDENSYLNPSKQSITTPEGVWLDIKDFSSIFKYSLILHNTKFYPHVVEVDNNWYNSGNDTYQTDIDKMVFHLSASSSKISNFSSKNNKTNPKNSCVLINFEPNSYKNDDLDIHISLREIKNYIVMELVDISGKIILDTEKLCLNTFFYTYQFDNILIDQEYFLIIKGGHIPFGYYLKIFSDHSINCFSYENYLKTFRGYTGYSFPINIPSIEQKKFHHLARFKLFTENESVSDTIIEVILKKFPDNYLKNFIKILVIMVNPYTQKESSHHVELNQEIYMQRGCDYLINFCIIPPYNTLDITFDIEILTQNKNLMIELIENIDPFEISGKYINQKHGIIFKELMYIPMDTIVYTSFEIYLAETNSQNLNLKEKIKLKLVIFREDKIIFDGVFFDNILIQHVILNNTTNDKINSNLPKTNKMQKQVTGILANNSNSSNENIPFMIICHYDQSECKQEFLDKISNLNWFIRVFPSDSIVIVKDNLKEENAKFMIESWEQNEVGRHHKSEKARIKFLLELRKEKGEQLNKEEELILCEVRSRKNKTIITNLNEEKITGKNVKTSQINNKRVKNFNPLNEKSHRNSGLVLLDAEVQNNNNILFEKVTLSPSKYKSILYKNFTSLAYQDRVKYIGQGNNPYGRTEEDIIKIHHDIISNTDESCDKIKKEIEKKLMEICHMKMKIGKYYTDNIRKRNRNQKRIFHDLNELREKFIESGEQNVLQE